MYSPSSSLPRFFPCYFLLIINHETEEEKMKYKKTWDSETFTSFKTDCTIHLDEGKIYFILWFAKCFKDIVMKNSVLFFQ